MGSQERMRRALDQLLYLPHLQAQHAEPSLPVASPGSGGGGGGEGAAAGRGRPWDRGDLFRRLATFKSGTWFCKPQPISPVECARRGWTNTGADLLTCEFCKAKLSCPIAVELAPEEAAAAGERYAHRLGSVHDAACPWRTGTSALSLLQFPPLTQEAVRRDFEARCAALHRLLCLPPVAAETLDTLAAAASQHRLAQLLLPALPGQATQQTPQQQQQQQGSAAAAPDGSSAEPDARAAVGEGVALLGSGAFEARARVLALSGWDLKLMTTAGAAAARGGGGGGGQPQQEPAELPVHVGPESAALECSLCAAKAGLWAFFPRCKPRVLQVPRRAGSAAGGSNGAAGAVVASAGLAKSAVSRNVAADIGFTIAGGAMQSGAAAAAAAPSGASAQQQPAFGGPPAVAPAAAAEQDGGSAAGNTQQQPQGGPAAASPFGSGAGCGSLPAFGFAALQASRPAHEAAAGGAGGTSRGLLAAGGASIKRKQPDFSWTAVLAEIESKSTADKRSKLAAAAGTAAAAAPPAGVSPSSAAAANGQAGGGSGSSAQQQQQQQQAAREAAGLKYGASEASPMDPLALHRSFCPWVNCSQAGEKEGRCGWRWCLQQLAEAPTAAEAAAAAAAAGTDEDEEGGGGSGGRGREWNPSKLLRSVLQQVDVHK